MKAGEAVWSALTACFFGGAAFLGTCAGFAVTAGSVVVSTLCCNLFSSAYFNTSCLRTWPLGPVAVIYDGNTPNLRR